MREHNILVLILHSCQEVWAPDLSEVLELLMFSFLLVCKDSSQVLECPWKSLHSEGCLFWCWISSVVVGVFLVGSLVFFLLQLRHMRTMPSLAGSDLNCRLWALHHGKYSSFPAFLPCRESIWSHYSSILGTPEKQRLNLSVWAGREWHCLQRPNQSVWPVHSSCREVSHSQRWGNKTESNRALQDRLFPPPRPPCVPDVNEGFARELDESRIRPKWVSSSKGV